MTTLAMITRFSLAFLLLAIPNLGVFAQSVSPRALVSTGGHGTGSNFSLGWTLGQVASATYGVPTYAITAGVQQPEGVLLGLNIRVLLDGPYREQASLMHDSLRTTGLLPITEPYSAMGLAPTSWIGSAGIPPTALSVQGSDAIVDWVYIELRDASDPALMVASRAALLQRDGDVVDNDGTSPLRIMALPGSYRIVVMHRNHLSVMTQSAIALGTTSTMVDLIDGSTPIYGTDALRIRGSVRMLWAGDTNADGVVRYTGPENDRDPVLMQIGGLVPTATASGYLPTDLNLDGSVRYTGQDNDRDIILSTIGGSLPTATRFAQLP